MRARAGQRPATFRSVAAALLLACGAAFAQGPALADGPTKGASAQRSGAQAPALPEDVLPESDFDDPIGIDATSRALGDAVPSPTAQPSEPAIDLRYGPVPPPLSVRTGEILTAVAAARETAHRAFVQLAPGRARVSVELELSSAATAPCEVLYRLALPRTARVRTLEVCNAHGCRSAEAEHAAPGRSAYDVAVLARAQKRGKPQLPVAHARLDDGSAALVVRAAPVVAREPVTLRIGYEADAPMHGGVVRFELPARGMDPRAAPSEVTLQADALLDAKLGGVDASREQALVVDPWSSLAFEARVPSGGAAHVELERAACGNSETRDTCVRALAWAGPRELEPRDVVIALDVSPSTEGPARGRLLAALAAMLESAPPGSRVRALVFAARARALIEEPRAPEEVSLAPFDEQIQSAELGAATRFEAVWTQMEPWLAHRKRGLRPLVVVLGDGGLTTGASQAFELARRKRVEVSVVNVADREATPALRQGALRTGGVVLDAGADAERAVRGRTPTLLVERMRALFAPTVAALSLLDRTSRELGPLRAGEGVLRVERAGVGARLRAGGRTAALGRRRDGYAVEALADGSAWVAVDPRDRLRAARAEARWPAPSPGSCDRRGPAASHSALSSDDVPLARAEDRACAGATPGPTSQASQPATLGKGMPADPLLGMLRQRVMPLARGCFRTDRKGRAEYAKRAVFVFALAEREVVSAEVEGAISPELRDCLLSAVDGLDVPRFTGLVRVRYPLVTESVEQAPQIELTSGTETAIERVMGPAGPVDLPGSLP